MLSIQETVTHLQALRDELTRRVEAIESDIQHKKEPVEKDFAEQVTQRENDEVLAALDEEAQQTIISIDAALSRINDGSYGLCSSCGIKIPDERLSALPYTTSCINCAK